MSKKSIRILLADDHEVMRDGLRALLEGESDFLIVGEAETGESAVELSESLKCDIVIMDLSMPGMSGLDAIRAIRKKRLPAHIVVLSMHTDADVVLQAVKAGCDGYVPKSTAHTNLLEAIRVVERGERYLHPIAATSVINGLNKKEGKAFLLENLSEREQKVIQLSALGFTGEEIGQKLIISPKTVETYRRRAMAKLGLEHRSELVRFALQAGLLEEETVF
jgi:DNA-binding NarL/FixJ family response regulator